MWSNIKLTIPSRRGSPAVPGMAEPDILHDILAARDHMIAHNKQRLHKAGLLSAEDLSQKQHEPQQQHRQQPPQPKLDKKKPPKQTVEPTRKSRRLAQKEQRKREGDALEEEGVEGAVEDENEFETKQLRGSHNNRWSSGSQRSKSWEERIAEVDLSGLVNFDTNNESAEFLMTGSRGTPYRVRLNTSGESARKRRSCECADNRTRKRDCKHIRHCLQQIGCTDNPESWFEVMIRSMIMQRLPHLGEVDVQQKKEQFKAQKEGTMYGVANESSSRQQSNMHRKSESDVVKPEQVDEKDDNEDKPDDLG